MGTKRFIMISVLCAICYCIAGCSGSGDSSDPGSGSGSAQTDQTGAVSAQGVGSSENHGEAGVGVVVPGEDFAPAAGEEVSFAGEGKKRISYTGNRSSAVYVTSVDDLPGYEELKQYDSDFFEEHALLLVTETVNSGSIEVGILSISASDSVGTVTLYHDDGGGDVSTDDMATWLLWAEVDAGLEYRWVVANPALKSGTETY